MYALQNANCLRGWSEACRRIGTSDSDESGEITEFLVAAIQTKGAERGKAKKLVDHAYREREKQEMRRLLYVVATRAREELHLFARPEYKNRKRWWPELAEPRESLLKTAWPALEEEIRARFDEWRPRAQTHGF